MTILAPSDYKTNCWRGGSTAQIHIEPAESTLQARDFEWRLSMATIEAEESVFTPFVGYARALCVLTSAIEVEIHGERKKLEPGETLYFHGEDEVKSFGRTVDFGVIFRPELAFRLDHVQEEVIGPCVAFDAQTRETFFLERGESLKREKLIALRRAKP